MKRIFIVLLAVALTACGAPAAEQPTAAPAEPSPSPVVIVQTVIVEASPAPTDVPPPTAVPPTEAPPTAVPPVVVTVVVEPTQASVQPTAAQPSGNAPITLDNALGKGAFINMTMSSNAFTLRCFPRDITFNITANLPDIADTLLYYRMVDLKRLYPSEWKNFGKMVNNGGGNFSLTFTGENVHPDLRLDKGWFDFQFVSLNRAGTVVDRSEGIESMVTYSIDCP